MKSMASTLFKHSSFGVCILPREWPASLFSPVWQSSLACHGFGGLYLPLALQSDTLRPMNRLDGKMYVHKFSKLFNQLTMLQDYSIQNTSVQAMFWPISVRKT